MAKEPKTELQTAPEPMPVVEPVYQAPQPRQKTIERQGSASEPYVRHYPQVRGGICEFCGVIDPNVSSEHQYKLCPHYRGQQLRCSYCDESKNPDDIAGHHVLNITDHPTNPDMMVVCCDSYECTRKHRERFKIA